MPEIDTDLFQILTLALLFLSLLSILAALSVLSGIKKRMEEGPAADSAGTQATQGYGYEAPAAAYEPAAYEPAASYEPAATYGATQPATQTQEVDTGFVSVADAAPAAQTSTPSLTGGLRGDEPEEQPFERDGRWWFKRGGELLVYDEGTGQWVAAPATATAGSSPAAAAAYSTEPAAVQTSVTPRADTGEGWKCSSCGAVNGSTATTCRMCFAPR